MLGKIEKLLQLYYCKTDDFKVDNNLYLVFCIVFHSPSGHKPSEQNLHQNFKLIQI